MNCTQLEHGEDLQEGAASCIKEVVKDSEQPFFPL